LPLSAGARMPSPHPLAMAALAVALAGALAGCQRAPSPVGEPAQAGNATAPAAGTEAGEVVSGIDLAGIDKSVQPGDDFNAYANGTWEKNTKIPNDRSSTGAFVE